MMNRSIAREKAMQVLFQLDVNNSEPAEAIQSFLGEEEGNYFLTGLVEGVTQNQGGIDAIIVKHLENWTIDRIAAVEKTNLRIATYENHYMEDNHKSYSINKTDEIT